MDKIDYHTHTNLSDGVLSPEELVIKAKNNGCKSIAITDHDYAANYDDLAEKYNITIIPGIEFNTSIRNMHILGYGMSDIESVNNYLLKVKLENEKICLEVVRLMQESGYEVSIELLFQFLRENNLSTEILDKRKLVKYLIYKGYSSSVIDTYNTLIGYGQKFYVPNVKLSPEDVINLINKSNGVAVLAHPNTLGLEFEELKMKITKLKENGLMGIEIINGCNNLPFSQSYSLIADSLSLFKTAGSDFHTPSNENIGIMVDDEIPRTFEKVLELKRK